MAQRGSRVVSEQVRGVVAKAVKEPVSVETIVVPDPGPGEVKVFTSSVETGESEESVPATYAGPDIDIGFNDQYLLDFLRAISQEQVSFEL